MVPEREIPGTRANACAKPIKRATPHPGFFQSSRASARRVLHRIAPVTRKAVAGTKGLSKSPSIASRKNTPTIPAGERREGEQPYVPPSISVSPKRAVQQIDEAAPIDHDHGNQRGHMYGDFELHARNLQAEQRLADHQVSGTRYREKFGRPLESPEENRLPNAHSSESTLRLCVSMTLRQKSS